ncbi:MAG: hypothetical protein KatS3mg102_0861 [Planctomycetota bacterium]|nr:MAG: hypothetical protein KatS3mg102_0861 [Planctomycetota bacterium]
MPPGEPTHRSPAWHAAAALLALLAIALPARAQQRDEPFDPRSYLAPDATPVDLELARRAVARAAAGVERFEARYTLLRRGREVGWFRVRYARPGRLRLDVEVDGRPLAYVLAERSFATRAEGQVVRVELSELFAGLSRCFERAAPLAALPAGGEPAGEPAGGEQSVRFGVALGYRVVFELPPGGEAAGRVWAGLHVTRRPMVHLGVPDALFESADWHAYHRGEVLRFVRPHHDLEVRRASGILERYQLRSAGEVLREARLVELHQEVPPFPAEVFELPGRVDEQASSAAALSLVSQALGVALEVLAELYLRALAATPGGAEAAGAQTAAVARAAFAEALAGAFAEPLAHQSVALVRELWPALAASVPEPARRARLVRSMVQQRLQAALAHALEVHGVRGRLSTGALAGAARAHGLAPQEAELRTLQAALQAAADDLLARVVREAVEPLVRALAAPPR